MTSSRKVLASMVTTYSGMIRRDVPCYPFGSIPFIYCFALQAIPETSPEPIFCRTRCFGHIQINNQSIVFCLFPLLKIKLL